VKSNFLFGGFKLNFFSCRSVCLLVVTSTYNTKKLWSLKFQNRLHVVIYLIESGFDHDLAKDLHTRQPSCCKKKKAEIRQIARLNELIFRKSQVIWRGYVSLYFFWKEDKPLLFDVYSYIIDYRRQCQALMLKKLSYKRIKRRPAIYIGFVSQQRL
jgi:hypothetical protein